MDTNEVNNLREVYNKENPTEEPISAGSPKAVWGKLTKRLHKRCKDGAAACIVKSMMVKQTAPDSWNTNPEEWLSSVDIDKVEKEYCRVLSNYGYLGTIPIDFDKKSGMGTCVVNALCSINIADIYKRGKTQIGIVFNTDVSTGPGQHWVAIFCDIRPDLEYPRFTYFDSYAEEPEEEIVRLMKRWKEQWDKTGVHSKPMELTYNSTKHQYENSECGMYCLYFHYCCLTGTSMRDRVPDKVVRGFRGMLFSVGKK